ncbi:MAG TPA: hypothetical protein QF753_13725 [Victivallales bacterium]|nr:hypothetical protein [Victivallales bacterium]
MFKNIYISLLLLSCFIFVGCALTSTNFSKMTDLPTENLVPYRSDIGATSYGYTIIGLIIIGSPTYQETINKIWRDSKIPKNERENYSLVNIRTSSGTSWSIFVMSRNYLNINADIAKYRNLKDQKNF